MNLLSPPYPIPPNLTFVGLVVPLVVALLSLHSDGDMQVISLKIQTYNSYYQGKHQGGIMTMDLQQTPHVTRCHLLLHWNQEMTQAHAPSKFCELL